MMLTMLVRDPAQGVHEHRQPSKKLIFGNVNESS